MLTEIFVIFTVVNGRVLLEKRKHVFTMTSYYLFYFCTDKVLYYHDLTTKVDKNNGGHVVAR